MVSEIYDVEVTNLAGKTESLSQYTGRPLLIVNTASKCGFTPQYADLQALYEEYGERGLVVLGFPCNQFGKQEPLEDSEIGAFCSKNYGVEFPMHEKIDVNGGAQHRLYEILTREAPGAFGTHRIKWNFTKFLVDREGLVVERFAPMTSPDKLKGAIEKLLEN
jgi:glutathione peroxidase